MRFRDGYKYQLIDTHVEETQIKPPDDLSCQFLFLGTSGNLIIGTGYAWDGPSGPSFDSKSAMRASLVHDALYQLMRMGYLNEGCREKADLELGRILKEDGMWRLRRWYWLKGVRLFAAKAAKKGNVKPILEAP